MPTLPFHVEKPHPSQPEASAQVNITDTAQTLAHTLVLRPRRGWQPVDILELWSQRQLLQFLIWREIKLRYAQTALGALWAVLQPLLSMLIFTVFFNRLAGIQADGPPYPLFAYTGLVLWSFFANAISTSSNSLVGNERLISKVYFPRALLPLAVAVSFLLDLVVGLALLFILMAYYRWPPDMGILLVPFYILGTFLTAGGIGLIFSALNVRFRDVKYAIPFFVQMGLFISPVIYPLTYVPQRFQALLAINPMVGLLSGFRAALLGSEVQPLLVVISGIVAVILFFLGLYLFRHMERDFADTI
jgi:lipopolysaccharide transport system permease protein